jgi:acetoin utilization deacetylase AcuC-like enzyme
MGATDGTPAPLGMITHRSYLLHQTPPGHPESPGRLVAIWDELKRRRLWERLVHIQPRPATVEQLHLAHSPQYVQLARREILAGRPTLSTGDTDVCPRSYEAALLACGGAIVGVEAVCSGQARSAFCALRPPGHHATASAGMGFCVFNNAAVAARHARRALGIQRVLIVDWDVHHGNGTQEIFYDDPSVLFFSTHELGNYPMPLTGLGQADQTGGAGARGATLNCPLPRGSGDAAFLAALADRLVPACAEFGPELVIVSAGFDGRIGDPLGSLTVTDEGFARATRIVMDIAAATAGGRVVSLLEGGYNLAGLASAAAVHVETLMGADSHRS